jgi:uncharacterized protein involved in exopolysaccharide biosynthesis
MRLAARLYPAAWRARYGEEFEALLEDIGPGWRDVWNVLGGALKMQMTTWGFWKLVPALGLAGAIAMAVAAFTMQPRYESSGVMRVTPTAVREAPGQSLEREMSDQVRHRVVAMVIKAEDPTSLKEIIHDERLYFRGVGKGTMEDAVAQLQRDIRFVPSDGARVLAVSFRYPDAIKAQRVIQKLMTLMMAGNTGDATEGQTPSLVEVLDPASLPSKPVYPNWPFMIAIGLGAGALIGCLYSARSGWRVVLFSGAVGAPLAIGLSALVWGRPILYSHAPPVLAVGGCLLGLTVGSVVVLLRRRPAVK